MKSLRHKKLIIIVISLFFLSGLFMSWKMYHLVNSPLIAKQDPPQIIIIAPSASASKFAHLLEDKKLIHSTKFFLLMVRFVGLSQHLKAGVYEIKPGETAKELLQRVSRGDVITKSFVIIEGSTQKRIMQNLSNAPYLDYHLDDWRGIQGHYPNAEGLLLADTYQYQGGSSGRALLEYAYKNLINYLNSAWEHRDAGLPYQNPYELLTAASIIEKETAIYQERKLISGVMVNRLKKKMPLQMDPTVIYGLGDAYTGKLSHNDMQINSPYNSYRYRGLPPTPIAMVGKEAIDAAAHPQLSNYLYFVAKGDGSHQFSETYEQQRQAIEHYRHKEF